MKRLLALAMIVACERTAAPTGQILLYFDTDATIPLFDNLDVDVYPPNATTPCLHCTRRFALSEELLRSVERPDGKGASIGIPIRPGESGWRVRARLFTSTATLTGNPPDPRGDVAPQSVVDVTAALPAIEATGIVARTLVLHVADVGAPRGSLAAPATTDPGRPSHSLVGTWGGAKTMDCTGDIAPDEACVPGGAFWMGNPRTITETFDSDVRRLVVVSPFVMQRTEVTVAQFRAANVIGRPKLWTGNTSGGASDDYCTFTASPGPHENLPVNCIPRLLARTYCQSLGRDLPTDAQFERAASALDGHLFVWGDEHQPECDDALFGAGGSGALDTFQAPCMPATPLDGILPPGSKKRDRLAVGGAEIVDLAGSMSEWTLDQWDMQDGPCWGMPGVFVDPVCTEGASESARGAMWFDDSGHLAAAVRRQITPKSDGIGVGFRCVRAGQ